MSNRLGGLLGLFILLAGGAGVYLLSRQAPGGEEESEETVATVVPVAVGQIRRMTLHDYVQAYGSVVPNPGVAGVAPAGAQVDSSADGVVTEVHCTVGQQVKRGQVLFSLYDRPAKLAVDQAEQTLRFAEENLMRQDKLRQIEGTSTKLFLEAQQQRDIARNALNRAQAELELLKVAAPFDAEVVEILAGAGEAVGRTETLAHLIDLTRLAVRADVPTPQAARLQAGQETQIGTAGSPDPAGLSTTMPSARIDYIGPQVDPRNDTVPVVIGLPADTSLHPGQFVRVRITVAEYADQLAVPSTSIVTTPEGQTVLAVVQGEDAVPTPVKQGVREGDWVQVSGEGLEPGMHVVTAGAYGLPGRTRIRVIGQ